MTMAAPLFTKEAGVHPHLALQSSKSRYGSCVMQTQPQANYGWLALNEPVAQSLFPLATRNLKITYREAGQCFSPGSTYSQRLQPAWSKGVYTF